MCQEIDESRAKALASDFRLTTQMIFVGWKYGNTARMRKFYQRVYEIRMSGEYDDAKRYLAPCY